MSIKQVDRELLKGLQERFLQDIELADNDDVFVQSAGLLTVLRYLRETAAFECDWFNDVTAVDYPTHFEVVYHLTSRRLNHRLTVKVKLDRENPVIDSVTVIWPGADFEEREVYDLMGISFNGHPDLRRILMDDDFVGHPLRKDFSQEG